MINLDAWTEIERARQAERDRQQAQQNTPTIPYTPSEANISGYQGWAPEGNGTWGRWDLGGHTTTSTANLEAATVSNFARQLTKPQAQFAVQNQLSLAGQQTPITPGMLNPGQVAPIRPPSFEAPEAPRQGLVGRLQDSRRVSTEGFDRQQRLGQAQANTATTDALGAARRVADPGRSVYDTRLQQMMTGGFTPDDPSYQWRMDQGMENLSRSSAARGMLGSGNVLAELTNYAQGAASQEYGAQFNRLLSASQNATQQYSAAYDTLGRMLGQQQGQQQLGLAGNQFRLANEAQIDNRRQFRDQLGLDYGRLGLGYDQLTSQQGVNYGELNLRRQAQADSTALDRAQFLQQGNQFGQDQAQDWARIAQGWGNQALGFSAGDTNAYNASINAGQLALERNRFNANETRLNNYDQGIGAGLMSGAGIFGG